MDTFIDGLAQRRTAQEMIKANAAAEAEELHGLRNQVREYHECLTQIHKLNEETNKAVLQMGNMLDESAVSKLEQLIQSYMSKTTEAEPGKAIKLLEENLIPRIEQLEQNIQTKTEEMLSQINKKLSQMEEGISDEKDSTSREDTLETLDKMLSGKFEKSGEHVHKESVKVYRNVQAVVVEEAVRQNEMLSETLNPLSGKMKAIFGLALGALITAFGGLVFQLLVYLRVI